MKKTLLLATVAGLFTFQANAADFKPYIGADLGYSQAELNNVWSNFDDNFVIANINLGTKIGNYFGIEASAQSSNKNESYGVDLSYNSYGVDVFGYLPINNVELFASTGVGFYTFEAERDGFSLSEDKTSLRVGLGAMYNFNDSWAMRGMVRHVFVDSDAVDSITELNAGIRYSF